jgi:hypothetical protein
VAPKPQDNQGNQGTSLQEEAAVEAAKIGALVSQTLPSSTIQLPPGYTPPPRLVRGDVSGGMGVSNLTPYEGRGLVDQGGRPEMRPDGTVREQYLDSDIRYEWLQLPFNVRQQYVDRFKEMKLISKNQRLDPNLVGNVELQAFSSVLYSANVEGRTWRAVLPIIASRARMLPGEGKVYKPTSVADIQAALQTQARSELGRELRGKEARTLAERVQKQEVEQQAKAGEQPTSTATLIEQELQKGFGAESESYKAIQYIDHILKT